MITNVRKFGAGGAFAPIETEPPECACCEAARGVVWVGAGVVFFEEENGPIKRVENLGLAWPLMFLCKEVRTGINLKYVELQGRRAAERLGFRS